MGNLRFILWVSLCLVSMILWQKWQEDYPATAQHQGEQVEQESLVDLPIMPDQNSLDSLTLADVKDSSSNENFALSTPSLVNVKTDVYEINLSKIGASIKKVALLDYPVEIDKPDQPIILMHDRPAFFYIKQGGILSKNGGPTHKSTFVSTSDSYVLADTEEQLLVPFIWQDENGLRVQKIYQFSRDSYLINVTYRIENNTPNIWQGHAYNQLHRSNPGRTSNILYTYTGSALSSPESRYEKISFGDMEDNPIDRNITDGWVAMLQHYFVTALIPSNAEQTYNYYTLTPEANRYVIGMTAPAIQIAPNTTGEFTQQLYIGPKIQSDLEKIAPGLELTVDYGLLWFLSKPLFWCLEKFHSIVGNWGWSIILVTIMLKILFFPFSAAGYRSMANMRRVQPRLIALRDRFKDDRMKLNQAMMQLYKEEKINPFKGCLPILIQIPVFIALYWTLLESVELRQSAFIFWLVDLSSPDPFYVLPLLMGVTMILQQKLNPAPIDPIQQKVMSLLPIVFTIFFAFFPSGLVLYWVVNNILSILQQWIITRNIERATKPLPQ